MPKMSKRMPGADEIAEMASRGEKISLYFTGKFTVVRPVRRAMWISLKACFAIRMSGPPG